jgi:hypothetical protein
VSDIEGVNDPLLGELTDDQQFLLSVIGRILEEIGDWPVFDCVEWRLDQRGVDANTVIISLPVMTRGPFSYGLVRGDPSRGPQLRSDDRAVLTAAGLCWLPPDLAAVRDLSAGYLHMLS